MQQKLDILVIAAHPDDAELACAGTLALSAAQGKKTGIVDLTKGEMGTRGTPELRLKEANDSANILGLTVRENLGFEDVFFRNDKERQTEIARIIRKYQPEILITNAISDRHPDHGKSAETVRDAVFLAGLQKVPTIADGKLQKPYRPRAIYHFIQNNYLEPDFIVDVSDFWKQKIESIKAYASQFYDPESKEPETFISSEGFLKFVEARHREFGHRIGVEYGEGYTINRNIGVKDITDLI
ncbi:MAG TPA: bacillithiol biosynthesis deacetylase BshB1 [Cytophagales bacterium]|jgi:bacillithiol biosynthesis deacetylase BshB1|nr:bacillithiol biosynthesis deacetylase BshB1 [Cytophagales bacterium]